MFFHPTLFSLKRHYLTLLDRFNKKKEFLTEAESTSFQKSLIAAKEALLKKERKTAAELLHKLDKEPLLKKSLFRRTLEGVLGLAIAIVLATVIRQSWFELYEIPTGSMRPTFREKDFLSVSKTAFGINIPLQVGHFLFDEKNIQRGSAIIFTGENLDLPDVDTTFLGIFPYKKRYIKRLIGKEGDTLYFYGGTLIGLDKEGHEIHDFENPSWIRGLEYIPFINFEGKVTSPSDGELLFKQMNLPFAKMEFKSPGNSQASFMTSKGWEESTPAFFSLWGMDNFAKARLIDSKEAQKFGYSPKEKAELFLEIFHHPSLKNPEITKMGNGVRLALHTEKSLLPLSQSNIDHLFDNLYTARFVVENGRARRYSASEVGLSEGGVPFAGVPDGTYEFYFGKGYQVGLGAIDYELPKEHPLLKRDVATLKKLYNLGIEFDNRFLPKNGALFLPSRFVYFKEGNLFGMGGVIAEKEEPLLLNFVKKEKESLLGFYDRPPPSLSTEEGKAFLEEKGLHIPENEVLVLGDNHAMSGDSRIFGFVPHDNLQGAPSLIFWPAGPRWGIPNMVPYPLFPSSRLIVWGIALLSFGSFWIYQRSKVNSRFTSL